MFFHKKDYSPTKMDTKKTAGERKIPKIIFLKKLDNCEMMISASSLSCIFLIKTIEPIASRIIEAKVEIAV